jgi:hypothetical protein
LPAQGVGRRRSRRARGVRAKQVKRRCEQAVQGLFVQRTDGRERIDVLDETDLASIHVANSCCNALIQQRIADRYVGERWIAQPSHGVVGAKLVPKKILAQPTERWMQTKRARLDQLHGGRVEADGGSTPDLDHRHGS